MGEAIKQRRRNFGATEVINSPRLDRRVLSDELGLRRGRALVSGWCQVKLTFLNIHLRRFPAME